MVNIYYGRESCEKNRFMSEHIEGKTTVIVPDQATLEYEKDVFEYTGTSGFMDLEILGFSRLFDRVLDECGKDGRTLIDKYGRHMLLTGILDRKKDRLTVYKNLEKTPGFIDMVNNFLAQIRQNNVSAEMFGMIAESVEEDSLLKRKLADLSVIYTEYENVLSDKYIDSENYIDSVVSKMSECRYLKDRTIWIAGFDTFTEKNYDVIRRLMVICPQVNFLLTYDEKCPDEDLFVLTGAAAGKISAAAQEEGIQVEFEKISGYEREKTAALSHLEKQLFSMPYVSSDDCSGITVVNAGSKYAEAESAAAYITGLVRDKGLKYREIALVCNSLETDMPVISRVFSRYGIPVFMDMKRDISKSSIVTFVMSLLGIVTDGYDSRHIFSMLKTGLAGFTDEETENLENYAIRFRIRGGMWKKEFTRGTDEYEEGGFEAIENTRKRLADMLAGFEQEFKKSRKTADRVTAVYRFLTDELDIIGKVREETDRLSSDGYMQEAAHTAQVWNILAGLLSQIYELAGQEECSAAEFGKLLYAGISQAQTGIIPQAADGVSAGTCQRSRLRNIKALVVMSADEGTLPMNTSSEDLLSNDELEFLEEMDIHLLKLDSIRQREESLGIYRTFSAPSEYLWIGTSAVGTSGDGIKPSPVIATLRGIFPGLKLTPDIFNSGSPMDLVAGPESTMEHLACALREGREGKPVDDVMRQVAGWAAGSSEYGLDEIEKGLFHSGRIEKAEKEKVISLYSRGRETVKLSPSGLEKYGRCPFAFFVNYALSPKEKRIYEMAGREIGEVYHQILMEMSKVLTVEGIPLTDEKSPWMRISEEEFGKLMDEITAAETEGYSEGLLNFSGEEKYRSARLAEAVKNIGWILVLQVRAGKIKEAAFEEGFGRGRKLPPLEIETESGKVLVEGIIDRIDILPDDSIKIIDYKTGKESFSTKEAKAGWKLQLMIYLEAGLKYGGADRKPAGVFYFNISEPDIESESRGDAGDAYNMKDFRLSGAVINNPDTVSYIAGDFEGRSEVACLRNGKDGIVGTTSESLFEPEEFQQFMEEVEEKVKQLCSDILEGEIAPAPKKKNGMSSCTYCGYKGICRFDAVFPGCSYEWI